MLECLIIVPAQTIGDHYLSALYWTFTTMSTTGYGDLVPVNDDERVYTLCIMVCLSRYPLLCPFSVLAMMQSLHRTCAQNEHFEVQ
jgi:hypothetical protein